MSVARHLIERLSRGKTFRRNLPADFHRRPVIVSPDAALRYLASSSYAFEPALLQIADEFVKPGDTVWDIGANLGVFAVAAGDRAGETGRVLAVEADIWLAGVIRRTARLTANQDLHLEVLPAAVSDSHGVMRFAIAERGRASNSLVDAGGRSTTGGVRETHLVPTLPLDALLETTGPPQVVKIDVEGAEVLVLEGARQVLSSARPVVYVEVGKEHAEAVTTLLREHDYELFNPEEPSGQRSRLELCVFNTLALPRELAGEGGSVIASPEPVELK